MKFVIKIYENHLQRSLIFSSVAGFQLLQAYNY